MLQLKGEVTGRGQIQERWYFVYSPHWVQTNWFYTAGVFTEREEEATFVVIWHYLNKIELN